MQRLKRRWEKIFFQFIKFGIVGFSNTIISIIVYYILIYFGCQYIIANTCGFLLSVMNAFYWNNKYVFKDKKEDNIKKVFLKVFLSYGGSFLISTTMITLFVEVLHISQWLAPILRLVVTVPINFMLNKVWAFRDKE